jgi:hypothetical protein
MQAVAIALVAVIATVWAALHFYDAQDKLPAEKLNAIMECLENATVMEVRLPQNRVVRAMKGDLLYDQSLYRLRDAVQNHARRKSFSPGESEIQFFDCDGSMCLRMDLFNGAAAMDGYVFDMHDGGVLELLIRDSQ